MNEFKRILELSGIIEEGRSKFPKLSADIAKFNDAYQKLDKKIAKANDGRGPDDYEVPSSELHTHMRTIKAEIDKMLGIV